MTTDQTKIEAAAEKFEEEFVRELNKSWDEGSIGRSFQNPAFDGFKAGVQWRDSSPPEWVVNLVKFANKVSEPGLCECCLCEICDANSALAQVPPEVMKAAAEVLK